MSSNIQHPKKKTIYSWFSLKSARSFCYTINKSFIGQTVKAPSFGICFLISIGVTLSMFILTQWPPHSIYVILFSWKVKLKVKMSGYKSRSLAAVHKTHKEKKRKENRPISSHLYLKVVNNAYGIWMRMGKNKPAKNHGITKALAN